MVSSARTQEDLESYAELAATVARHDAAERRRDARLRTVGEIVEPKLAEIEARSAVAMGSVSTPSAESVDRNNERRERPKPTDAWVATLREAMREPGDRRIPIRSEARTRYNDLLVAAAKEWQRRGFSVVPLRFGTKLPFAGYRRFGRVKPSNSELRTWRSKRRYGGLAFVLGSASSPDAAYELVLLDIDDRELAQRWRAQAGDLSRCIVAATDKGMHVYFLARSASLPVHLPGNPDKPRKVVPLSRDEEKKSSCGELRMRGTIGVAPPSLHPKSTPSAPRWYREEGDPLTVNDLLRVDDLPAFLGPEICAGTLRHSADSQVKAMLRGESPASGAATYADLFERAKAFGLETGRPGPKPKREPKIELPPLLPYSLQKLSVQRVEDRAFSVERCIPFAVGEREAHSLIFARHLRGYGDWLILHDAAWNATNPKLIFDVVTEFHEAQPEELRKDFSTVYNEVVRALRQVKHAIDREGLQFFIDEAERRPSPACVAGYLKYGATSDHVRIVELFHVLYETALKNGLDRFYITQEAVGKLLLDVSQPTAGKAMNAVEGVFGAFKCVQKGHTGKASEYVMRCSCDWSAYRKPGG